MDVNTRCKGRTYFLRFCRGKIKKAKSKKKQHQKEGNASHGRRRTTVDRPANGNRQTILVITLCDFRTIETRRDWIKHLISVVLSPVHRSMKRPPRAPKTEGVDRDQFI